MLRIFETTGALVHLAENVLPQNTNALVALFAYNVIVQEEIDDFMSHSME
jgi:hypothetical protein